MDNLALSCCQYPDCLDYGKRGHGNLTVCGYYGTQQRSVLYCKSCKARFSERKGLPCSTPTWQRTKFSPSSPISPRAAASARPADLSA